MNEKQIYSLEVAKVIIQQIIAGVGLNVYFSWGIHKTAAVYVGKNPALLLQVDGLLYSGIVTIELTPADYYRVKLYDREGGITKDIDDICFDELGTKLDGLIEKDPSLSEDEYYKIAMADSDRKIAEESCHVG